MDIGTDTKVAAVSKIKIATAFLFLGGAALAASAAGGLAGRGRPAPQPDLIIDSVVLNGPEGPISTDGSLTSGYDLYTVTYKNIGKVKVDTQFGLYVETSPAPYMTWGGGDPVMQLLSDGGSLGDGYSGGSENLSLTSAVQLNKSGYFMKLTAGANEDSGSFPGLNKYALAPGEKGQAKVYISKFYQDMMGTGAARFKFVIDYAVKSTTGQIKESNEKNNVKSMQIASSEYSVVPANLCGLVDPALGQEICKNAGGSFVCIDKYTQWYSSCAKEASQCGEKIKTLVPCEVDTANGQPYFKEVTVTINGTYSKTFDMSFAKGTYQKSAVFEYPYELKDLIKTVDISVTAKNANTSTKYGYLQVGGYGDAFKTTDLTDTMPANLKNYLSLKWVPLVWSPSATYTFSSNLGYFTLYTLLDNKDTTYFGFPNTKLADDALIFKLFPADPPPGPQLPTTTPSPTSTAGSGSNPTTTVASTLSIVANSMPLKIPQGNNQLVGDFTVSTVGPYNLCLTKISSSVANSPSGTIKFGALSIVDYASGIQIIKSDNPESFYGIEYYANKLNYNPVCIEPGGSKRLQFFLDGIAYNDQTYTGWLAHVLYKIEFNSKDPMTGEIGKNLTLYPDMTNGGVEVQ